MAKKKKFKLHIHPQANKKLARLAREVKKERGGWSMREVARRCDVNVRYVLDNLEKGIEPPDTTDEGRATRMKLFMKEYKPRPKKERAPDTRPEWLKKTKKAISKMARDTNDAVVRRKATT